MSDGEAKMEFSDDEKRLVLSIRRVIQSRRGITQEAKHTARQLSVLIRRNKHRGVT